MATVTALRARPAAPVARTEEKRVKIHRRGGSFSVTLPKSWLPGITDGDTVLMRRRSGIIEIAPARRTRDIEDEPEFALFMNHLLKDALAHPDRLTPAADALSGLHELLAGVEPDL